MGVTGVERTLATGVIDELPGIAGFDDCYGTSVFHCPHCDGWEWRDAKLVAFGFGADAVVCATNVPGVFVAGDASRDAQFVVVAAAKGVKAAVAINKALQDGS